MASHNPTKWPFTLKPAAPDGATILAYERSRSSINVEQLSKHLLTPAFLERQARILSILQKERLFSKSTQASLSRPDRYRLGLARGKRLRQLVDQHRWDDEDYKMAEYLVDDVLPYHLHTAMFVAAVREQADDAQRAYWMPKLESWEVVGAYAQTELGHGSNVRGIECEARWDPERKEFVIHSPTLTASKWWNGTLGRTATHAVVIARLLVPDGREYVDHGPRPFIVRVRDAKTHLPPESIVVGDIGPKYGYASMDNAYMLFNQHRVPYDALLCRYASVNPETGVYARPRNSTSVYGTMTRNRSIIVMNARLALARAVTVAVRYLCIRRQFRDQDTDSNSLEVNVLDYSTVQIRVLPLLATLFALNYSGAAMWDLWQRTRNSNELDNDHAELSELHVTSSGLKSLATELAANGVETCRRSMGGHGYGGGSGLVQLNADYLSKPTVEGDNWMITQQVARALLKKIKEKPGFTRKIALSRTDEYLKRYEDGKGGQASLHVLAEDSAIVEAFERRTASLAFKAYYAREVEGRSWNSLLIDFHKLSRSYSQAMLVANFHAAVVSQTSFDATMHEAFLNLFRLFSFTTMDAEAREFQTCGAVSNEDLDLLPAQVLQIMQSLRPHCVRLVDAWAVPDYLLDSALGQHDGKVYEDLFHQAHVLNPLNKVTFNPDYKNDELVLGSGDAGRILSKL